MTFPLIIVNFNHFFIQPAPDQSDERIAVKIKSTRSVFTRADINFNRNILLFLGVPYSVHVTTGDVRNASTSANVFVVLYGGEDGQKNSGKLVLRNENNDNFERGRTDINILELIELSSINKVSLV